MRLQNLFVLVAVSYLPGGLGQTISDCHPYPGADAKDCLQLISDNLNNETPGSCNANGKPVTSDVVRRALTVIGKCALNEYGSISGHYIDVNGVKTCYLYPPP